MRSNELFPAIFSRHAAAYQRRLEGIMERGEAPSRSLVIEWLDVQPGMRVLDLACGPGTLSVRLARLVLPGGELVGVDLAPGMLDLARAAGAPNARFEVMDIERLLFPDATFDAAACGHGLHFVPQLDVALREARRVLRPGGRFAASVPLADAGSSVWSLLLGVVDRHLPPAPQPADRALTRETVVDPQRFAQAVREAGFSTVQVDVVHETVHWKSAEQLVSLFASWWDCASRLDGLDAEGRHAFIEEATTTLQREHPGAIETAGNSHVLRAVA
ncbi:MAG: methyltransferase domain-containing protein [Candidatus Dormibacter sp.]